MRAILRELGMPVGPLALEEIPHAGEPGSQVPGTLLIRDFCSRCGEPIAINPAEHLGMRHCEDCRRAARRKKLQDAAEARRRAKAAAAPAVASEAAG